MFLFTQSSFHQGWLAFLETAMSPNEEKNIEFRGGWQRLEQLYTQNQIYHYFNIKILNLLVGYFTCRGTIVNPALRAPRSGYGIDDGSTAGNL